MTGTSPMNGSTSISNTASFGHAGMHLEQDRQSQSQRCVPSFRGGFRFWSARYRSPVRALVEKRSRVAQHRPGRASSAFEPGSGIARPRRPHDELGNRPRAGRMHPLFQVDEVAGEPAVASRPQKVGAGRHRHEARGDAVGRVVRVDARGE